MNKYLVSFDHDSKRLGYAGKGQLLITADSFEQACNKIKYFAIEQVNIHHKPEPYYWNEYFDNARNFVNLTID